MNITQINDELIRLRQAIAGRERAERDLARAETSLAEAQKNLQALAERFRKEDAQVRRLEGVSLVGLVYTVLGSKAARLDEERQALLSIKLKYDSAQRAVAGLERDAADLRRQAEGLADLRGQYDQLLAEKEALVKAEPGMVEPETTRQLMTLREQLADARCQDQELNEAIQAGELAYSGLDRAVQALESASSWGTWDILGGGMISSAVKHSRLDEAQAAIQDVEPLLQRFERELMDVGGTIQVNMEMGGLTAFADIFIDSLLVDLFVQSRISDSLDAARGMAARIRSLVAQLTRRREAILNQSRAAEKERRTLLERVGS